MSEAIKSQLEKDRFLALTENDTFHSVNTNHVRHAIISIFGKNDKNKICLYGPYTVPVKSWGGSEDIDVIFDQASPHVTKLSSVLSVMVQGGVEGTAGSEHHTHGSFFKKIHNTELHQEDIEGDWTPGSA